MDGVLVDVTESYRESITQTVRHFAGVELSRSRFRSTRIRGGTTTGSFRITSARPPSRRAVRGVKEYFQSIFLGGQRRADTANSGWRARRFENSPKASISPLHRTPRPDAAITLERFAGGSRSIR